MAVNEMEQLRASANATPGEQHIDETTLQPQSIAHPGEETRPHGGGQIIGHTPMERFGKAEELGGVVVWLASHAASSFVTGQNIVVDGGLSAW